MNDGLKNEENEVDLLNWFYDYSWLFHDWFILHEDEIDYVLVQSVEINKLSINELAFDSDDKQKEAIESFFFYTKYFIS